MNEEFEKKFNFDDLYPTENENEYSRYSRGELEQKLNTLYKEEQKIKTALIGEKPNNRLRFIREIEKCKSIIARIRAEKEKFFGDTYSEETMLKMYYNYTYGIPFDYLNSDSKDEKRNAEACLISKEYEEWKDYFLSDATFETFVKYMTEKGVHKGEFGMPEFDKDVQEFVIKYSSYIRFLTNYFDVANKRKASYGELNIWNETVNELDNNLTKRVNGEDE